MTDQPIDDGPQTEPEPFPKCALCGKRHQPGPCPKSRVAPEQEEA